VALYLDGLSFHHSAASKKIMEELDIYPMKQVAYSPEYMVNEQLWRLVKARYQWDLFHFLTRHPASELKLLKLVTEIMESNLDFNYKRQVAERYGMLCRAVGVVFQN
jgi:hypothetical protein